MANVAIIAAGSATAVVVSPWPDLFVGIGIFAMNLDASRQVYVAARDERRANPRSRSTLRPRAERRLAIRSLRWARTFVLAGARQPEAAVASCLPVSALPPPHFRYPPQRISSLNGICVSVWALPLPPLHSRHQQTLMQHEIASVRASPGSPDRHLPASVLLAVTPPAMPMLWTCDRAR
jgi:hypothetical protein